MAALARIILGVLLIAVLGGGTPAVRVALVIGNGDYAAAGKLANPVNDAEDVAAKLRALGFTVVDGYNLGKRNLETKIGEFADALDGASAGLFYYAGHGIQVGGRNFLVPVDAHLDIPAKLKLESIPIDDVMDLMQQQAGTAILILDACRNNPFARSLATTATTRGVTGAEGLAQIDGGKGSFIAFSTAPGSVAMDGTGRNSPFAAALLRHMGEPGQSINDLMIAVRRDVVEETKDFQTPMSWDSLTDRFAFVPGGTVGQQLEMPKPQAAAPADPAAVAKEEIRTFITGHYLKPDAANFVETTAAMFTDPATSFGRQYARADLVSAKQKWFDKWASWKLNLLPDTLKVSLIDDATATATFDMRYRYTPKDTGTGAIAGTAHVYLDLVKEQGAWKIELESSKVDGE